MRSLGASEMLDELHLQPPASPPASRSPVWACGWVAVTVAAYALALKAGARGGPGSRLLVLRVFASKRQALQLVQLPDGAARRQS